MKGLALANVFVLSCIWSNANGLRLNVNVDINPSDEPGKIDSDEASLVKV